MAGNSSISARPGLGRPSAMKAPSAARPVRLDFSGWNCVAHTVPDSTAATTGPP